MLLLSRRCDDGLCHVQDLLARAGLPAARLDADDVAGAGLLLDAEAGVLRLHGLWLAPTVSWVRHFSAQAIPGGGGPEPDLFLREAWQASAAALADSGAVQVAPVRHGMPQQLRLARRLGVPVPRTILAADLAGARAALRCRRLVVKAVQGHFTEAVPGMLTGRFAVVVDAQALPDAACDGPLVVQEYVEHDAELRLYYLDGPVLGFSIAKQAPADPWTAPERVGARRITPPAQLVAAVRRLAGAMSLRYGAFDFLAGEGGPVFLEANPDGDWRWVERAAGTNAVTHGVARMLADLHRAASPGNGAAPPLNLLSFLTSRPPTTRTAVPPPSGC